MAGGVFMELPKFSRADILIDLVLRGNTPGCEAPVRPDEPDVLDVSFVTPQLFTVAKSKITVVLCEVILRSPSILDT